MGFSSLANMKRRIPDGGRRNNRNSKIKGFTIHHNAGVNSYGEAQNPRREVSANYWITNEGVIIPNVDEKYRAWTTGSVNYPAGAQSDHRNITVEVSNSPAGVKNGTWAISDKAYNALVRLIGDVFKRHRLGTVKRGKNSGVAVHQDFVPTACPGAYIMSHLGKIIKEAEAYRKSGSKPSPAPTPIKNSPANSSIAKLAREVMAGKYGNGEARKRALGSKYNAVQAEVNRRLGIVTSTSSSSKTGSGTKSISQLADEVMRGKYGNGADRKKALGSSYAKVQAEVNRRLGLTSSSKSSKSISQLADEVMRGKHGNGAARKKSLGSYYSAVQLEVNRRLGIR